MRWSRCGLSAAVSARARFIRSLSKGRKQFLHTLREPAQPIFVYDEAQVKIYFAHYDPEIALPHIEREHRFADALGSLSPKFVGRHEKPRREPNSRRHD